MTLQLFSQQRISIHAFENELLSFFFMFTVTENTCQICGFSGVPVVTPLTAKMPETAAVSILT
jgi:hypothetical protein